MVTRNKGKICCVKGCDEEAHCKRMCRLHYGRMRCSGRTYLINKYVNPNPYLHGEKNKYRNPVNTKEPICTLCGAKLFKTNTYKNALKLHHYKCKSCARKKSRLYHRKHLISRTGGNPHRVKKKVPAWPEKGTCMLCGQKPRRKTGLNFHHWEIVDDIAYGVWLCCVCHMFAERYDNGFCSIYKLLKHEYLTVGRKE